MYLHETRVNSENSIQCVYFYFTLHYRTRQLIAWCHMTKTQYRATLPQPIKMYKKQRQGKINQSEKRWGVIIIINESIRHFQAVMLDRFLSAENLTDNIRTYPIRIMWLGQNGCKWEFVCRKKEDWFYKSFWRSVGCWWKWDRSNNNYKHTLLGHFRK